MPFVLILKEPDLGSALVLLPTGLVMMLVAGTPRKYLVWLIGGVGIVGLLFVADVLFAPSHLRIPVQEYQRQRLLVYFGKDFADANATPAEQRRGATVAARAFVSGTAGADRRRLRRHFGQGLAAGTADRR